MILFVVLIIHQILCSVPKQLKSLQRKNCNGNAYGNDRKELNCRLMNESKATSSASRMRKPRANNKTYYVKERSENLKRITNLRSNDTFSNKEKMDNASRMKHIRASETYSQRERQYNTKSVKANRTDDKFSQRENHQNQTRMKTIRACEMYSQKEKQKQDKNEDHQGQ